MDRPEKTVRASAARPPSVLRRLLLVAPLALLAACSGGGGGNGGGNSPPPPPPPPPPPATSVQVSGTVNFEFVPPNANCAGLNFSATESRPIRGATVQLVAAASGNVLATTTSSPAGAYSFSGIDINTMVRLRVRAELKSTTPSWDVEVRDNVVDPTDPSPPVLASRPQYVTEGSNFDTGSADVVRNLTAATGWGGSSFTGTRASAPFAILDGIYTAIQFNLAVDPNLVYPPMDVFWSVNNTTQVTNFDIDTGELGSSFYAGSLDSLFIVGDATDDADEFDTHVVVHEYGHYFDDQFLRTESPGGTHFLGDKLDARLAFNEGWPTAFAGMVLNEDLYCDTGVPGTSGGFGINAEGGAFGGQGWYDEISVVRFMYDLWDTNNEGTDTGSIGFDPIYVTMTDTFRSSEALGTLFSFAAELRPILDTAGQALLNAQLGDEQVDAAVLNIWGDNEPNDGNPPTGQDVTPLYTDFVADGSTLNICSNGQFDSRGDGNKLSQDRYLRIAVPVTDQYDVTVATTTAGLPVPSDPDIYLYDTYIRVAQGTSPNADLEQFRTTTLDAGKTYAAIVEDWRFDDPDKPVDYPGRVCMNVTFAPTP